MAPTKDFAELRSWLSDDSLRSMEEEDGYEGGDYIAIDFETANEQRASACAVGIAVGEGGRVVYSRAWLIRPPEMRFVPFNIGIHGIRPKDVGDAPEFIDLWPVLRKYLDGRPVVAHNAGFDISVLQSTLDVYGLESPAFEYACTVSIAKTVWPELTNHRLNTVSRHLGLELKHHDPREDAEAAAAIVASACEAVGCEKIGQLTVELGMKPRCFQSIARPPRRPPRTGPGPESRG